MIQDGIDYGEGYEKATEPGPEVEFWTGEKWLPRFESKESLCSSYKYRKPIKPKEKDMSDKMIPVRDSALWDYQATSQKYCVTLAEAERLGAEAQRIKAENEIKAGDWFWDKTERCPRKAHDINRVKVYYLMAVSQHWVGVENAAKITNPTHIQALNEIYEGMK